MTPKRDLLGSNIKTRLAFSGDDAYEQLVLAVCEKPRNLIISFVWDCIEDDAVENVWDPILEVLQDEIQERSARRKIRS